MSRIKQCLLLTLFFSGDVFSKHATSRFNSYGNFKIVGGQNITIQDVPYQVAVYLTDEMIFRCEGSIINKRHILTIAQCLQGYDAAYIRIGSTYYQNGGTIYNSSSITIHPKFNLSTADYDVAVIKISEDMNLDGINAKAVQLATDDSDDTAGTELLIAGWGTISEADKNPASEYLQGVKVPVVSFEECQKAYSHTRNVTARMLCTRLSGKGPCKGDAGSAAVEPRSGKQLGIVSWSRGCARADSPTVYTKVSAVHNFIADNSRI